ncbi:peptidoglycan-binding protein [Defluviitalea phaphyphila]|uniref:peptidoglycan-binding protein n=1 Tax=Defluviitalea phaphyphila TaxID=1473580 RepID=UPI0007DC3F0C|nr:peptidoglycan-binding protein [Defluviitalea phaphyphila]
MLFRRYPIMSRQSTGNLVVDVFTKKQKQLLPVPDATVIIRERIRGTRQEQPVEILKTNESGKTPPISLNTPPIDLSLEPSPNQPYSTYDIEIQAPGYTTLLIEGSQIFADTTAIQNATLEPENTDMNRQLEEILINPHTLWGSYPPKIPEDPIKPEPPPTGFIVLDEPVIPQFVIVHDGVPDNTSAPNYTVGFKDYIKNVASSEIYPTWPESTIRANILAILSFTLNRVFTEWYRGKGYDFTITSSTAYDHAFSFGRNIYDSISQIVDEIFVNYIKRPGFRQPLLTQYCDGIKVECPTWMTQWGSKNLGDQGLDSISILRSYYGQNIFLDTAVRVAGIPSSYPGYKLTTGSSGAPVRKIQEQLNAISNNFPAIPKVKVDGNYGEQTANAVKTFQQIFNLTPDGVVGPATWYKISDVYVAVTKLGELI